MSRDAYYEDQIVKDLHHILALIAEDPSMWLDLGYGKDGYIAEEIIGFMLKSLSERGSKIACTGKIEDMAEYKDPEPDPLPRKEVISIQPGDVIACHSSLDGASLAEHAFLNKIFPNNEHIILTKGMSLEVYREQGKDEDGGCTRNDCPSCAVKCDWYLEKKAREQVKDED